MTVFRQCMFRPSAVCATCVQAGELKRERASNKKKQREFSKILKQLMGQVPAVSARALLALRCVATTIALCLRLRLSLRCYSHAVKSGTPSVSAEL